MKNMTRYTQLVLALALPCLVHAQDAAQVFTNLKALKGSWESSMGNEKVAVTYEVVSNETAVIERMGDMVTVFTLDGKSILATHFCAAGNQPRLRATSFTMGSKVDFDFVDISNLQPDSGYINHLHMEFTGND